MANDIKQKIVLDGEKDYNRALSEAKRNLKTLRSELKAETAELGANATAQQKNETRIKSLQKQIKEQEKIVSTYKAALAEVKSKYGDNEEAIAKWEQKLNDARTSLANMKNELEGVGKGFKDVQGSADMATVASKSVADSLGRLSEIGGAISDSIESVFTGMIDTVKGAVSELWSLITDTAARANNWTDLASYYGTTASEMERINYAVEATQGNFENFTTLLNQLSWGGKGQKITEWFGISDVNYENKLDYAMAVLDQMQRLQKEDPGKLGDAMEDIFGARKSQQIMWFVSNLDKLRENLASYDEHGYGMGDEALEQMNEVYFSLGEIEAKWDKLKDKFAAGFGTVTLDIMANVNGSLDALVDYFNADNDEDRNKALEKLEKNITEAFTRIGKAIEDGIAILDKVAKDLQGSDNPAAQTIGKIMQGLADALKWFTEDNMNNVVKALEILAAFWLTGKGLKLVGKLAEVAGHIATIKSFKLLSGAGDIASGASAAGSAAGASFGAAFTSAFATAAPVLAGILGIGAVVGAAVAPAIAAQAKDEQRIEETRSERLEAAAKMTGEAAQFLEQAANALGLKRDDNGNLVKNVLGQNWIGGNEQQIEDLLYGLNDRSDLQKMQLHNLLNGSFTSQGNDTWAELQRLWGGEAMDMGRLTSILESIADAYSLHGAEQEWWQKNGGNAGNTDGLTSADAKNMTDAIGRMPNAVAKSVSGIRVYLDGATVGRLVAPYVSESIGAAIV